MKKLVLSWLFLIKISIAVWSQSSLPGDSLVPFVATHITYKFRLSLVEIHVYKDFDGWYASKVLPFYYYGEKTDGIWITKLDSAKTVSIKKFLSKTLSMSQISNCSEHDRFPERVQLFLPESKLSFYGQCQWDGISLYGLEKILFKEHFAELKRKTDSTLNKIGEKLKGKWIVRNLRRGFKKGKLITLKKMKSGDESLYWEFDNTSGFKSVSYKPEELLFSDRYWISMVKGIIILYINGNWIEKKFYPGATFRLMDIGENKITMYKY